jgi:hypothetical protein
MTDQSEVVTLSVPPDPVGVVVPMARISYSSAEAELEKNKKISAHAVVMMNCTLPPVFLDLSLRQHHPVK